MVDRYKRLAPLSGVVMVVAIVVALSLGSSPDTKDSGAQVIQWYQHHHAAATAQSFLLAYAAALGVLYFTSVASFLRSRGSHVLAVTTTVGGAIMATGLLLGAGFNVTLVDRTTHLSTDTAQALNYLQDDAFGFMLFAGLFVATLSLGVAMLRTKSYPTALGVAAVIVGIGAGTGIVSWFAFMASGLITLVVACYTYYYLGQPQEITIPEIPAARASTESRTRARSQA